MRDHRHYFPILKSKAGEIEGLSRINPGIKPSLTPLIEVQPIPLKYEAQPGVPTGQKRSLEEHLYKVTEKLLVSWGKCIPILMDLLHLQDSGLIDDETHPLAYVLNLARSKGIQLIPVTGLDRNDSYQSALIGQIKADTPGVCVRVEREHCRCPTALDGKLGSLVSSLGLPASQVDLILDFGWIECSEETDVRRQIHDVVNELPNIREWRTLAFAATSMPKSCVKGLAPFQSKRICRVEWKIWKALADDADLLRIPSFCDYGITHPDAYDLDMRSIHLIGKVRYSTPSDWIIIKGRKIEKDDEQFHRLAQIVVDEQPEPRDADYCWGDGLIADCANFIEAPRSLEKWAAITTNHHLTLLTRELANVA